MNQSHDCNADPSETDSEFDSGDELPDLFTDWDESDLLEEVNPLTEKMVFADENLRDELSAFDERTDSLFRQVVASHETMDQLWVRKAVEKRLLEGLFEQQGLLNGAAETVEEEGCLPDGEDEKVPEEQ